MPLVQVIPKPKKLPQPRPARSSKNNYNCPYLKLAREFIRSLGWNDKLFDDSHDKCYCPNCYPAKLPDVLDAGNGHYVIPRKWVRLGVQVNNVFHELHDIWDQWIVTFHGTTLVGAQSILYNSRFCLPGDKLIDGTILGIRKGHIPDKKHIYTSPTIAYSSLPVYSPENEFYSSTTRRAYDVQIVLQCRQKPDSFKIQGETVGATTRRLCPHISNDKIEYFTEIRDSLVAYGLLVKLVERIDDTEF